jgi:hypothetical protein
MLDVRTTERLGVDELLPLARRDVPRRFDQGGEEGALLEPE